VVVALVLVIVPHPPVLKVPLGLVERNLEHRGHMCRGLNASSLLVDRELCSEI